MDPYDRENLPRIVAGEGTWFTAALLRLIAKADGINREKIRQIFPEEVAAYEAWQNGPE